MKSLVIFLILFSQSVYARDVLLKAEFEKCVALVSLPTDCPKNRICLPAKTGKHVACYKKLGFSPEDCDYQPTGLSCNSKTLVKTFPQFRGCDRLVLYLSEGKLIGEVTTDISKGQSCEMNGFAVKNESVPLFSIKKEGAGWAAAAPAFSYTLAKIIKKQDVVIESFRPEYDLPWKGYTDNDSACYGMKSLGVHNEPQERRRARRERLSKAIGLVQSSDYFPQRHYVGSDGPKEFPIVDQFKTLKEVRLCGVSVPAQTELRMAEFNESDCRSAVDGTVMISGLPIELFPPMKVKPGPTYVPKAICGPKARVESDVDDLAQKFELEKKPIELPKLSWDECECYQSADPSHDSR